MSTKFPLLLALSFVAGCEEVDPIIVDPPVDVALQNGIYPMRIDKVVDLECDVSERELRDWQAEVALAVKGREANAVIEDQIALSGSAKGAFVYLDGQGPSSRPEDDRPPRDGDDDDCFRGETEDVDHGEDSGESRPDKRRHGDDGDCGEDSGRSEPSEGSGGGEAEDTESHAAEYDEDTDTDVAEPEYAESFSLDLQALDAERGKGVFVVNMPGCYAELKVNVRWQRELERRRGGDEPVPVYEEGGEVEPTEECDGDEDCG